MFNISPLLAHNVGMLMNPQAVASFMQTYMRSSGFDTKATLTLNQKNARPIKRKDEYIPYWFPQYFDVSLSRQLGLPYSMKMKDGNEGWNAHIPPALSMIDTFKKSSQLNPADVFQMFKVQPGSLSGSDSVRLQQVISDAFAYTKLDSSNLFVSSKLDQAKVGTSNLIVGEVQNAGEGIYTNSNLIPFQITDQMDKFKKTIAEVVPYMDKDQVAAMINFTKGRDENGFQDVDNKRAIATNPNPITANQALIAKPGYRTLELMKGVAKQINLGKKIPVPYIQGQAFKQSAQNVANEQKFFKKTLMMQRKRLDESRFS